MGQPVHLQLFAESEAHGYDVAAAALAELRRVEARLSLFDDTSDLSELNRQAGRRWSLPSPRQTWPSCSRRGFEWSARPEVPSTRRSSR